MTDRYNALTVVLERDIREDDAETLLTAIRCLRGVLSVEPRVADMDDHIAQSLARRELGAALMNVLYPKVSP